MSPEEVRDHVSQGMHEIIMGLPGYDPYRDCEGYWFDEAAAWDAIEFFEACITHTKGHMAGKPYILEPHELALTANITGWKDDSGLRRYREVFYFVPRKNSKTTWCAGFALQILFMDNEQGAECYCAAADREQAALLYGQVEVMINNCTEMKDATMSHKTTKTTFFPSTNSLFRAISAEANTKHGFNSHLVIIDELHAQPNGELVDVLETSMGSRTQPLIMYITTSDYDKEGSICNQKHDYATQVRNGTVTDARFLPAIYEASIDDDWHDPKVWYKANPNLGKSISFDYIERAHQKAISVPTFENTFKRLHLNIRTQQDVRWLPVDKWDLCGDNYTEESLKGRKCYMGIDIASKVDLTSISLFFPRDGGNEHKCLCYNYIPEERAHEREHEDKVEYSVWERSQEYPHLLTFTLGDALDQNIIKRKVKELCKDFDVQAIGYDPYNASQLGVELLEDNLPVFEYRQSMTYMSPPVKELEAMVLSKEIKHDSNPMWRWCVGNIAAKLDDNENVKLVKKLSRGRIDPIIALVIAIGLWLQQAEPEPQNIYLERGLKFI